MTSSDDRRDPICGMTGVLERHGHWFCSERCIEAFERRPTSKVLATTPVLARLRDPWIWVPLSGLLLAGADRWWTGLAGTSAIYRDYVEKVGVPLFLGLILGGIIDHFVPKEYIVRLLAGPRKRVILRSALLGFLASACSHGCLALTVELYRKGASAPAAVSFLLASPWASLSLTLVLLGLFGVRGLILVGGALAIAVITGLIFQRLAARGLVESNPQTIAVSDAFSLGQDLRQRVRAYQWTMPQLMADARGVAAGIVPLGRMILGWVQLGLVLSAVLGSFVPHYVFERYLGASPLGLGLTLLAAAAIEVCSEGTAPLAYELYRHTGALGNSFAFLMGGVVTDYTELAVLWKAIGPRTVRWLLLVTLPLVLLAGFLLNAIGLPR